jgi:hypothetical protein
MGFTHQDLFGEILDEHCLKKKEAAIMLLLFTLQG